ncbi:MAG: TonB-dependent hemoglobin/transferrin/lactoferrin family receptor [Microvirgula sp.]
MRPLLSPFFACIAVVSPALSLADTAPAELDPVQVTTDRSRKKLSETAPNTTVISRDRLDASQAGNMADAIRYEPGVTVASDPNRRGNSGFTIRGIGGNRILMLIDGIRLPDAYLGGGTAISSRDYVDMEALQAIEIVKGPQSSLYGSDALGGVVGYRSKRIEDVLKPGARIGGGFRGFGASADDSHGATASLGLRNDRLDGLLVYTYRKGQATDSMGRNDRDGFARTAANPQDWHQDNVLARLGWQAGEQHRLEFTLENFSRLVDTRLLGSRNNARTGLTPRAERVDSQEAKDRLRRQRQSLAWNAHQLGPFQRIGATLYRQTLIERDSDVALGTETAWQGRRPVFRPGTQTHSSHAFTQTLTGINLELEQQFDALAASHRLVWGADLSRTDSARPRNRWRTYADGSTTRLIPSPRPGMQAERYPNKTFPDSVSDRIGLFAEDDMRFAGGLVVSPGLRWDFYRMRPLPDLAYRNANTTGQAVSRFRDSALSPKLGLALPFAGHYTGFLQLTTGFRAPPFDDASAAFTNTAHGYTILSNPALKSEKSRGAELGLKGAWAAFDFGLTAFHTRHSGFIDSVFLREDRNRTRFYQYRNRSRVDINGAEARMAWRFAPEWRLAGALAYVQGKERDGKQPIDSVAPPTALAGLRYGNEARGAEGFVRAAARQGRVRTPDGFRAPGHATLDLSAYWRPGKHMTLRADVLNVFDRKYWNAGDTRGRRFDDRALDRYTRPGRNFSASFELAI